MLSQRSFSFRRFIRKFYSLKDKAFEFSGPQSSDVEHISRELTRLSNQDDHILSSDDFINHSSSGYQFDMFHHADFIHSMKQYESFDLIYRQVRGKFGLSPEQFYSFKFTMECLREVIRKGNVNLQNEEEFFMALTWVVKTKGLEANEEGLNIRVVKIVSVIQDILYLLIYFEKTIAEKTLPAKVFSPVPKYVGLIFTNHPCGLNKDEASFQSLLAAIEKLHRSGASKKDVVREDILRILETLLESRINKLKPRVWDETLTLQEQLIRMSKTLVEHMEDSDDVEVRLDTWTGIEADRNATTPELQMQTVILNKMKGFEVYEHHLNKMMMEIVLMEIPEESDIPTGAFRESLVKSIDKEVQDKKRLRDFDNMDLSQESVDLVNIFRNSVKNFMKFEKGMKKGLSISQYLARLIVFRWLRDILLADGQTKVPEQLLKQNLKEFYASGQVAACQRNSYIADTINQFFYDTSIQSLFEEIASSFLPKVSLTAVQELEPVRHPQNQE